MVSLGVCTVVYLVVNLAYPYAPPLDALRGNPRVGEAAAQVFFGTAGGALGAGKSLARTS